MPTFGFSAFLKLLSMNDRPQRTTLTGRLRPSRSGGYDYHRSLRVRAHRYLVDGEVIEEVLASCGEITKPDEQHSARTGLENLHEWRRENPGGTVHFDPKMFESPDGMFKVHFTPNFGLQIDGRLTAVHLWNTARPQLDHRMTLAALSLFADPYATDSQPPDDLAVLSLREPRLYRLSEARAEHYVVGERTVAALDGVIGRIRDDLGLPPPPHPPHPPGP